MEFRLSLFHGERCVLCLSEIKWLSHLQILLSFTYVFYYSFLASCLLHASECYRIRFCEGFVAMQICSLKKRNCKANRFTYLTECSLNFATQKYNKLYVLKESRQRICFNYARMDVKYHITLRSYIVFSL